MDEQSISKANEGKVSPDSKRSPRADRGRASLSKGSFLYSKLVPAVLVILVITLIGTLTIVLLSILGVTPGG
jgi:hypothetical protein